MRLIWLPSLAKRVSFPQRAAYMFTRIHPDAQVKAFMLDDYLTRSAASPPPPVPPTTEQAAAGASSAAPAAEEAAGAGMSS